MSCTPTLTQAAMRYRNDNGNETTATWKAAEDAAATINVDENFRVRFAIQVTNACAAANAVFQLQYSLAGGTYTNVTASSSVVRSSASPNLADADNLTDQMTAGTGTFIGLTGFDEVNGAAGGPSLDIAASGQCQVEYCVQIRSADVANGQTIELRVTHANLAVWSSSPDITVNVPLTTLTAVKATMALTAKVATFETIVPPVQTGVTNISILEWPVPHSRALLFDKTPEAEAGTTLTADKGALTFSGQAGVFKESFLADKSSLAFTGKDATFAQLVALTADKGSLTFSPQSGLFKETFLADKSSLSLTAKDATFAQLVALTANKGSLAFTGKDATFSGVTAEIPILPGLFHFELPTPIPPDSLVAYSMPDFYPFGRVISLEQKRPESLITIAINLSLPVEANTLTASKGMLSFSPKPSLFEQALAANKNTLTFSSKDASFLQVVALLAEKGLVSFAGGTAGFTNILLATEGVLATSGATATFSELIRLLADRGVLTLTGDESVFSERLLAAKGAMDITGRTAGFPAGEAPALWPVTRAAVWR